MLPSDLPDWVKRPALDTECSGLYPDDGHRVADVSIAWYEDDNTITSYAFPFNHEPDDLPEFNLPEREWKALIDWLVTRDGLVMHGGLYDCQMMMVGTGNGFEGVDLLELVVWDTMLGQLVLDPGSKVGLDDTAKRLWDVDDKGEALKEIKSDLRRKKQKLHRYDLADWELVQPYAAIDARLTTRLAREQWYRFHDGEADIDELHHELDVMRSLARMERRGLPYDAVRSMRVARKLGRRREELRPQLPCEPKLIPMKEWFYDKHNYKPLKLTKNGADSLDAECLEHLISEGAPGAEAFARYKKVDLAEIRWYSAFARQIGQDGRLRARFTQTDVRSGRLSVRRLQLQAVPHDYQLQKSPDLSIHPTPRQLVIEPPGWAIWELDLAQAELRVAAWMARCKGMLKIIEDGGDPHGILATETFEVHPGDDDWTKYRQVAKRGDFSLIFGIGAPKLRVDVRQQTGIDLGLKRTRQMTTVFRELYPEFRRAIDHHERLAQNYGYVRLVNGRRNFFQDYEMPYLHKAFNRRVQGSIGELTKLWMVKADELLMSALPANPEMGLLLQIHDSLVICVPDDEHGEELASEVRQIGLDLWDDWFTNKAYGHVPGGVDMKRWGQK